jgi:hypothetical protein
MKVYGQLLVTANRYRLVRLLQELHLLLGKGIPRDNSLLKALDLHNISVSNRYSTLCEEDCLQS